MNSSTRNFLGPPPPARNASLSGAKPQVGGGDATGSGRAKVALAPGRGLLDWVRRCKAEDLSGRGGAPLRDVGAAELLQHSSADDCWLALHGRVYNVTAYMEYHPGGAPELMKGAGIDATDLFNQIHRWVNFESMLKACLVGRYVGGPSATAALTTRVDAAAGPAPSDAIASVSWDWEEAPEALLLVLRLPPGDDEPVQVQLLLGVPAGACSAEEALRLLTLRLVSPRRAFRLALVLHPELDPLSARPIPGAGAEVRVRLAKRTAGRSVSAVGRVLSEGALSASEDWLSAQLETRAWLTPNTQLLALRLPVGTHCPVPTGWHVHLRRAVEGELLVRAYTPVLPAPLAEDAAPGLLHLLIKVYADGALTPALGELALGSALELRPAEPGAGGFCARRLAGVTRLGLLAAGTGITPMVRLWRDALLGPVERNVDLLLFNQTLADVPWREELADAARRFPDRFLLEHVLSRPPDGWPGARGRVSAALLADRVRRWLAAPAAVLVCVCGPLGFVQLAVAALLECGLPRDRVHCFEG